MRVRRKTAIALLALAALPLLLAWQATVASAAGTPAWQLMVMPVPTNFESGSVGQASIGPTYRLAATNVGSVPTTGTATFTFTLPAGVTPLAGSAPAGPAPEANDSSSPDPTCSVGGQVVTCTAAGPVYPGHWFGAKVPVEVSAANGETFSGTASIAGGGGAEVSRSFPVRIESTPPPFGFLDGPEGLNAIVTGNSVLTGSVEAPPTAAGSHPGQLTVNVAFPIEQPLPGSPPTGAGKVRLVRTDLPPGLLGNPAATPRCTELQLTTSTGQGETLCPNASQIGEIIPVTGQGGPTLIASNLYNMEPPFGTPGVLGFEALNLGIYVHLIASVRSDGDYGVSVASDDIIARALSPILAVQAQVWGDPSGASHDGTRGKCRKDHGASGCGTEPLAKPFLSMPSACSGPLDIDAAVGSWEESGAPHHRSATLTEPQGNASDVTGCSSQKFNPTLTVKPDTTTAEAPTGVEIKLTVPQNEGKDELATSTLEGTKVSFPPGLVANAAAAGGQAACGPTQIGMLTGVGETPAHLSSSPPSCPDASKLGSLEVATPLLDHTLPGSVYLAQPYQNPFGTLLAAYLVIESPRDGIFAKVPSRIEADPNTGQLTATISEAPAVPFSEVKVDLFGGARAALRTPSTCGTFTTDTEATPWSGTPPVHYADSFQVNRGANGAACATSEAALPNSPSFEAGTETPIAASYSPFLGRLSRNDGTQQLTGLNMTLPKGLTGKLAGVSTCSDAAIAAAGAGSGGDELASPSCPPNSLLGEVEVGAGAGPSPFYTKGKIYLAGPYEGAPFSAVVITPAVAGPFDLGTVVVRAPSYVDPATAQVSVRSGSFPHILQGIPLDLRDARLTLGRSEFTLNPSNCDPASISGEAISLTGGSAPLAERFQVGGCSGLDYAPKLFLRLKGGTKRGAHPKLRAVLMAKPGEEANTARASVALPRSEFLENAHINTVCTRVQFAAHQCPKGSIYGSAKAFTPLLDEPLVGPVYLRSSSHELPDMVAALHGPPSRPIEVELVGRIDSVKGGIRSTFDTVPDQPVSKFILWMKGGKKGLIVNSRDLCKHTYRATAKFDGQNGKAHDFRPKMNASCAKKKGSRARHRRG